jgi:crotonobetainyl-CoA:carnitine CoA-transferase CaiB-like acyl-CoA transferase
MAEAPADYPLSGLKVLDFSRVLAGPFAGRLLSDLGADVVKVEPPEGDVTRNWGRVKGGVPGFFHQQNAGKRNICIDLRAPGARELVLDLVRQADVLIENYRPDVMGRLGLGYDVLSEANPRLIMLSISGFGAGGPESRRPAYAPIVHAEMGLIARQARRNDVRRTDLPLSVADTNASLHGLIGLLSAVILRQRTGLGQHIDIAMVDATLVTDEIVFDHVAARYVATGSTRRLGVGAGVRARRTVIWSVGSASVSVIVAVRPSGASRGSIAVTANAGAPFGAPGVGRAATRRSAALSSVSTPSARRARLNANVVAAGSGVGVPSIAGRLRARSRRPLATAP